MSPSLIKRESEMQKVIFLTHLALGVAFNDGISHKFYFYFQFHLESDNICTFLFHIGFSNEISKYFTSPNFMFI